MSEKVRKMGVLAIIGAMTPFMVTQVGFIMNPVLANISEVFPTLSYATISYLATLPSLISIPCNLLAGAIVGKKIKYRTLTMLGISLMVIGGVMPFFLSSFVAWCLCRCVVGVGMGLVMPLGGALISQLFQGEEAVKMQGIGTILLNITGVVLQLAAGSLVEINVNYAWLLHGALSFVILLTFFFMPEPVSRSTDNTITPAKSVVKKKLPWRVWFLSINFGFVFMFCFTLVMNISAIVTSENLGTSTVVGTLTALFTVGGVVGGLILDPASRLLKKWMIPAMHAVVVISLFIAYTSGSLFSLGFAGFLTGVGCFSIWPASVNEISELCESSQVSFATGLFIALLNVGSFLSSAFSGFANQLLGAEPRNPVILATIGMGICTIVWVSYRFNTKTKASKVSA